MKKTAILCPATIAIGLISSKWKAHLLFQISQFDSGCRFGELSRMLPGISKKVLTQSLIELVEDGFLTREEFPQIPPKVVYKMSLMGKSIEPIILSLAQFGLQYMNDNKEKLGQYFDSIEIENQIVEAKKQNLL
ncbi:MAG: helix-turn-helix transcriptional regulator [Reichenbachiella sp.]